MPRLNRNQNTGLITKPRYLGYDGHDKIFEGDILMFDDDKRCVIVRWQQNFGAWCFYDPREPKFRGFLYKILSAVNVIGHRDFCKQFLDIYGKQDKDKKIDLHEVKSDSGKDLFSFVNFEFCGYRNKRGDMLRYNKKLNIEV